MTNPATSGWSEAIFLASAVGPVAITVVLVWLVTRWWRSDPDAARLKQAQAEHERRQREAPR